MALLTACVARPVATIEVSAAPTSLSTVTPSPTPTAAFEVDYRELPTNYDGDKRLVGLYVPKLEPGRKVPLVVMLHAYRSSPFGANMLAHFDLVAERYGAIVAYPPSAGPGWDADGSPGAPDRDSRYLSALLTHLIAELPVDPRRVFVAGFSVGAEMADRVGCEFADRVAAVAIVSGTPWSDRCQPDRPVSVLVMHGTADSTFDYASAQTLAERWRRADGCSGDPTNSQLGPTATAEIVDGCHAGTEVEFVTFAGGTHEWFQEPDATQLAWQFFIAHPRS
ncbi:MAG: hypothetical protein DLM71_00215 [Chloroflexi bacterium]|nr:MAG: hypothetical protein DLM71_00215 [Chloroflexota bacterium]